MRRAYWIYINIFSTLASLEATPTGAVPVILEGG